MSVDISYKDNVGEYINGNLLGEFGERCWGKRNMWWEIFQGKIVTLIIMLEAVVDINYESELAEDVRENIT